MSKISSSNENFYSSIKQYQKNIDAIFGTTANIEDTEFYELCKKFSDIGLNAPKRVIEETCDVQGYFQDNDINIAVIETVAYIKHWKITEIDLLFELISNMHSLAVDWDETRQKSAFIKSAGYNYNGGYAGKLHNFSELPQDIFDKICCDIKDVLQNNK